MDTRTKLQTLALDINELLSAYIVVHDKLIKKSNSIFSVFTPINFDELATYSERILAFLKQKREEILIAKKEVENNHQKEFVDCLLDYTDALIKTDELLYKMLDDLRGKAHGEKLSLKQHMQNNKQYKDSIEEYTVQGERLNKLYRLL
jgi:hypothetical protein